MIILAVDPGTECSAWCLFETEARELVGTGQDPNPVLLEMLLRDAYRYDPEHTPLIVEMFRSYGNVMGDSVLTTCVWIGRFIQAWPGPHELVPRKTVVTQICQNPRANDSCVRMALIDRFSGGKGKGVGVGSKSSPGPLYGLKNDMWSALAIAVSWAEMREDLETKLK